MKFKFNLKIRHKIQLFILLTTFIIYSLAVGYISVNSKNMAYEDAVKISDNYAKGAANEVQIHLERYLTVVKNLSNTFKVYEDIKEENRRDILGDMMIKTLEENPDFAAVWSTWEPNSIDNLDSLYKNKKEFPLQFQINVYQFRKSQINHKFALFLKNIKDIFHFHL